MDHHASLIIVAGDGTSRPVPPLPLTRGADGGGYDEAWVRDLLFDHPASIPVDEIDAIFGPLIPVCRELDTRAAGFADALYLNPLGLPTLVEAKLWRNAEARREVVGQILDYARALRHWTYSDLQREAARARQEAGFNLFQHVRQRHPGLDETAFVDAVTRNLARGRLLLLIVGDGIRSGVEAIAEYLQAQAGLHFTFGLIQVGIFDLGQGSLVVQPRVLAKTKIVNRTVVDIRSPDITVVGDGQPEEEGAARVPSEREVWTRAFWEDLMSSIKLDDVDQPLARPSYASNVFFMFPTSGNLWLTAYFSEKDGAIGVFLGLNRASAVAMEVGRRLMAERDAIDREIALPVIWSQDSEGKVRVILSHRFTPLRDAAHRDEQLAWFRTTVNAFVNALRPRVIALWQEALDGGTA